MTVVRRGRVLSVCGFLLAGAIGIISSTQTWLTVERADGGEAVLVPGASAIVLLAPLSLAVLAIGAALSITGRGVRVALGVLGAAAALLLGWSSLALLVTDPVDAVGPAMTEATGLAGGALDDLVRSITPSAWPVIASIGWIVLLAASLLVLLTGHRWRTGGRRYRTEQSEPEHDGPIDSVDSWDDLSRGTDPTR